MCFRMLKLPIIARVCQPIQRHGKDPPNFNSGNQKGIGERENANNGRDLVMRYSDDFVDTPKYFHVLRFEPDLFFGFAQRSSLGRLILCVALPAGKGDLSAVVVERVGAARIKQMPLALKEGQRDEYRSAF